MHHLSVHHLVGASPQHASPNDEAPSGLFICLFILQVGEWQILVTNNGSGPTDVLGTMHVETRRLNIQQVLPIVIDADWALTTVEPSEIQTLQVTVSQGKR